MSTKLTTSPVAGYELVNSLSLQLLQEMSAFQTRLASWLLNRLHHNGFDQLTLSQLQFLGLLDCGTNHAANLARDLGISRQAVHKIVRELENLGWLETLPDPTLGNQKTINFSIEGERMMALARQYFQQLDRELIEFNGVDDLNRMIRILTFQPKS